MFILLLTLNPCISPYSVISIELVPLVTFSLRTYSIKCRNVSLAFAGLKICIYESTIRKFQRIGKDTLQSNGVKIQRLMLKSSLPQGFKM